MTKQLLNDEIKKKWKQVLVALIRCMTLGILLEKNVRMWRGTVWSAGFSARTLTSHKLYNARVKVR